MNIDAIITKLPYWSFVSENEKNILVRGTTYRT